MSQNDSHSPKQNPLDGLPRNEGTAYTRAATLAAPLEPTRAEIDLTIEEMEAQLTDQSLYGTSAKAQQFQHEAGISGNTNFISNSSSGGADKKEEEDERERRRVETELLARAAHTLLADLGRYVDGELAARDAAFAKVTVTIEFNYQNELGEAVQLPDQLAAQGMPKVAIADNIAGITKDPLAHNNGVIYGNEKDGFYRTGENGEIVRYSSTDNAAIAAHLRNTGSVSGSDPSAAGAAQRIETAFGEAKTAWKKGLDEAAAGEAHGANAANAQAQQQQLQHGIQTNSLTSNDVQGGQAALQGQRAVQSTPQTIASIQALSSVAGAGATITQVIIDAGRNNHPASAQDLKYLAQSYKISDGDLGKLVKILESDPATSQYMPARQLTSNEPAQTQQTTGSGSAPAPAPAPSASQNLITEKKAEIASILIAEAQSTNKPISDTGFREIALALGIPESDLQKLRASLETDPAMKKILEPAATNTASHTPQIFSGQAPEPVPVAEVAENVPVIQGLRPISGAESVYETADSGLSENFAAKARPPALAPGQAYENTYKPPAPGTTATV